MSPCRNIWAAMGKYSGLALFIWGSKGLKLQASALRGSRLVGTSPECCQSPSVNKSLIGCWPVRTGLHEKSNYCPCGFKAAPRWTMKGDKEDRFQGAPRRTPLAPEQKESQEWLNQREYGKRGEVTRCIKFSAYIRGMTQLQPCV